MPGQYCVDIVMCIDATGSMSPILNEVKNNALSFYQKFHDALEKSNRDVAELRVKVIAFRDYICDTDPMVESKFFNLPAERHEFKSFIDNIKACGGGDTPENALEAVATAMLSDWTVHGGEQRRHCIIVFTDADALPLGERRDCPSYPDNMPEDLAQLTDWWHGYDQEFESTYSPAAGRFVAFAPGTETWKSLNLWDCYWLTHSKAGFGLSDVAIDSAINVLVGSL